MASNFKILGINSDADVCECCGRKGLKKVVWLGNENGTVAYGVNCAATALRFAGAAKIWTLAQQADADRAKAELMKIHEVGEFRSVKTLVIESVGQNGGKVELLGYANGPKSEVEKWAEARWPHKCVMVRWAR